MHLRVVGKCEWPNKDKNYCMNMTGVLKERDASLKGKVSGLTTGQPKMVKLLPGERMGWWSSKKFDRRIRMRAHVRGAVNDVRTPILLDTGANVSIITTKFARRLKLKRVQGHGRQLEVQGIKKGSMNTTTRVIAKVTLGWNTVYEYAFWVMEHCAGSDVVLGTDFMIPAGIRPDLFNANAKLPGEVMVPLVKPPSWDEDSAEGRHVCGVLIPTITKFNLGQPTRIRLANITDKAVFRPAQLQVIVWVPRGYMPKTIGYVPIDSPKYEEWQVLAYAGSRDKTLPKRECELYEQWLASQPPAVDRRTYTPPTAIMQRVAGELSSDEEGSMDEVVQWNEGLGDEVGEESGVVPTAEKVIIATMDVSNSNKQDTTVAETHDLLGDRTSMKLSDKGDWSSDECSPTTSHDVESVSAAEIDELEKTYVCVAQELSADGNFDNDDDDYVIHEANYILLEDYAHELAFLPDLTESSITTLDYDSPNVKNPELSGSQQQQLIDVLKKHESIMISSSNALPPPAYGVICDIDVDNHAPIKQKACRIPLRFLRKLYQLLKGLPKAGLIAFSNSPWALPIVIVLKKNDEDIRLCIDYKMVNHVTTVMEYAMPLVDGLLTELESYLSFCSLDAASGFWAIMMTMRARKVSAFPQDGWKEFADTMRTAEDEVKLLRRGNYDSKATDHTAQTKFKADGDWLLESDPVLRLVNTATADMFATNEPDQSVLHRSFVDDVCFGSTTFDDCLGTLDNLLMRFEECKISFHEKHFCQSNVDFLSHEVSSTGIRADVKKMTAITELPFPKSKKGMQQFLGALNYYGRFIQDFAVFGAVLYQLKDEDFTEEGDLSGAKESFRILQRNVAEAPILRHFDEAKEIYVMLYANEWALSATLMQMHDDKLHPVFCGRVLKDAEMNYHSAEKEVRALLLPMKICYTQLAGKKLHVYTRFSTLAWVYKSKSLFGRAVQFAVLLSPWELEFKRIKEKRLRVFTITTVDDY
ncbi:LOW QUALITY PROTEIN: hypothetical protein PHMEG_00020870 [Phytophthora megakarya]|uniref:Reverse transcriptase/retrotransposon-derived protein RNase H-like domain-containing protein n=1 Tax=Phytophthora megakarya TaxID=4795 RepID=A0A225VNB7_9STRA|nr:LOW QUALITY PROTEIN: hypothetical protein PHMEG_00020870 [Phytophthora megakarya]